MKQILFIILTTIIGFVGGLIAEKYIVDNTDISLPIPTPFIRSLDKYSIESLRNANFPKGIIKIERELKSTDNYTSYLFSHTFNPEIEGQTKKKVTGLINIPKGEGQFPVIVMIRGFVDQKLYKTGIGTRRGGEFLAEKGYITVAPDFLGYGESDREAGNVLETRFQTYTTVISIINSISSIDRWNTKNIGIWAHSNGGQVALTILEAKEYNYPTVLWAPVSKPFPYSVLYYTDESEDKGKYLRKVISDFETNYDASLYSFDNYLDKIKAKVQIHQGTVDDAIPVEWTKSLAISLRKKDIETELVIHPGADHDLNPLWNVAIEKSWSFYENNFNNE